MSRSAGHGRKERSSGNDAVWELIRTLVLGEASAEDILEIYYWTRDPEILQMLRSVVLLPDVSRRQLTGFFSESDPKHIKVVAQPSPRGLILSG
jgi:hypothetical protein